MDHGGKEAGGGAQPRVGVEGKSRDGTGPAACARWRPVDKKQTGGFVGSGQH